jgi:NADH:ubiquinone reductase (H+-translocating)
MSDANGINLDVAILGGGFAGVYCAKTLGKALGRHSNVRIGLISERNYTVFQPLLPEVVGASISPRHVVNSLRLLCRHAEVLKGKVENISWPERRLVLHAGDFVGKVVVQFQHLVLALGATIDLSRIPGMPEHAFLMQNAADAMLVRSTIIGRIEEANLETRPDVRRRLLTFVVVGGGYSGVETAGQILDLFSGIHRYYPNVSRSDLDVVLVHSSKHILPTLNRKLGEYTARVLRQRGLNLVLDDRVRSVTAHGVHLQSGRTIEAHTVVSTVGNAPHPLVTDLCQSNQLPTEKGRILTDPSGQVHGQTHLWAAGDCAAFPFIQGGYCPDTAQFAMRQGRLLGQNIARTLRNTTLLPLTFKGLGQMASIGHHRAVGNVLGVNFSGFFAWWLWRTIYLGKLPGLDRKLRVVIDWTMELFFPRDINLLNPRYTRVLKQVYLEPGSVLFRKGDPAFSLYIVKSGCVEIGDESGLVQSIGPGEYFGERALLEDRVWQFNGRTSQPTVLVSIPADTFRQIVQGTGSLGRLFLKSAAKYQSREIIQTLISRLPSRVLGLHAAQIMQPNVRTLHPRMTVRQAISLTRSHPHSVYPAVDDDGHILGVVQRSDFHDFLKNAHTSPDTPLEHLGFRTRPIVKPDTPVADVMETIIRTGTNKALVADDTNRLQGIITLIDLMAEDKNTAANNLATSPPSNQS